MSDSQVVTCGDCGTRMRMPEGKTKGRCPKCKRSIELSAATSNSPVSASTDASSQILCEAATPSENVQIPNRPLRRRSVTAFRALILLVAVCGGYVWMYTEIKQLRSDLATVARREAEASLAAQQNKSLAEIRAETEQIDSKIAQLSSQVIESSDRLASVESTQDALKTNQLKLAQETESTKRSRDELLETTKRIAKLESQSSRPLIEVQPSLPSAPAAPAATPARRSADLILVSLSVQATNANGDPWDRSGDPDLLVHVSCDGRSAESSVAQDTCFHRFNEKLIRVYVGDTLKITVIDKDVFENDTIAEYEKVITDDTLNAGTVDWSFKQVDSLAIKFEP